VGLVLNFDGGRLMEDVVLWLKAGATGVIILLTPSKGEFPLKRVVL
jgi:hypothetical protein